MKKRVFGKKLSRDINERKALFKSLMSSLVLNEKIITTEAKAKAIRPQIEKLVTKAKDTKKSARKILEKNLSSKALEKIITEVAPRFNKRQGGYTRLIRVGERLGDNANLVMLEWVEKAEINSLEKTKEEKKEQKSSKTKPAIKKPRKSVKPKKRPEKTK